MSLDFEEPENSAPHQPFASFVCPSEAVAARLAEALGLWGASAVTLKSRAVDLECASAGDLVRLMALFNDGALELLEEGELSPAEILERIRRSRADAEASQ